jgi:hypothetical protein
MTAATFDRFDIKEAHFLFWSEHHSGQFSDGYIRMCKALKNFKPAPGLCWETLSDNGKDIYRDLCKREWEQCEYDTLSYLLEEEEWDTDDDCVAWFVERYNENPEDLCNYDRSDFVNLDMCYTKDLLDFYDRNEESVLHWLDGYCDALGYTSRLQVVEGDTIEDPDDLKTAFVNHAMTYLGSSLLSLYQDREG